MDVWMDGWMEMPPPTRGGVEMEMPPPLAAGAQRANRDTNREETELHGLEAALSKARPRCTPWQSCQQPQTAPIRGFEPARLGLKQEMFLQSDKITSDPEKLPFFPSAEMPGTGAGHLMNYETLGNERLCREALNISFPRAWLLPAGVMRME